MTTLGQLLMLLAFAASGHAAFACVLPGPTTDPHRFRGGGLRAGVASVAALTLGLLVLGWALFARDFRFAYVAQYSSRVLPWYYALSALWVGQAGSLLLWTWMLGCLALVFLMGSHTAARGLELDDSSALATRAFGLLMGYVCFLTGTMIFAADPMEASRAPSPDGAGLSPLLQHPSMLIHPPVVFLGYAGCAVPCALALAAFGSPRFDRDWLRRLRNWSLASWSILGAGILLGAQWSYEELGWGGYWAWDPVENASLIPWLTGTALIHSLMAWKARGVFKKTALTLAVATFALCNFATFLTRSGIFSSLHAFSQSPIGWLFLAMMAGLAVSGLALLWARRGDLRPDASLVSALSCETLAGVSIVALVLLALLVTGGTFFVAFSEALVGHRVIVGPAFYNNALCAVGTVLLATIAPAPLLQWGAAPSAGRVRVLAASVLLASALVSAAVGLGFRSFALLAVLWVFGVASVALLARVVLDAARQTPFGWRAVAKTLAQGRTRYAGFSAHLGFCCLAFGVAGSSLGTDRTEFDLSEGAELAWKGRGVQLLRLDRRSEGEKVVVEAQLVLSESDGSRSTLRPAQVLHRHASSWTTEAAIQPSWGGDIYAILHNGEGSRAHFSLVFNPLMRWLWLGGWVIGISAVVGLWPRSRDARRLAAMSSRGDLPETEATPKRHSPSSRRDRAGHARRSVPAEES